jgi:hypothetical protein
MRQINIKMYMRITGGATGKKAWDIFLQSLSPGVRAR